MSQSPKRGVVYTETTIHTAPEKYVGDAPYQVAIVDLEDEGRHTVRISPSGTGDRVRIGDQVIFKAEKDGVAYYEPASLGFQKE